MSGSTSSHRARLLALCLATSSVAGCYDPNLVSPSDEILLLSATPSAIPANGFSTAQIIAKVHPSSDRALRIGFSTSGGTLSVTATQLRSPDSNGEVAAFLTSEATPKSVIVTADVKNGETIVASRSVPVLFEPVTPSSVIRLILSSTRVDADGSSSIQVRAEVNPGLGNRAVTFTTTNGSFVRDRNPPVTELKDIQTGSDGVARAQLFAPLSVGSALVTATAGGFSAGETVTFVPALPDAIAVLATPLEQSRASETNTIQVTATLSRRVGIVSPNTRVGFSITNDASGESFGRFENVSRSGDNEQAGAQFVPGTAAPLGLATITARVADTNIRARVKVNITE